MLFIRAYAHGSSNRPQAVDGSTNSAPTNRQIRDAQRSQANVFRQPTNARPARSNGAGNGR